MTADEPAHSGIDSLITPSMRRAATNVGRAFVLLVTIYVLIVMRGQSDIAVNLALTGAATLGVWLLFGRGNSGARMLVIYLIGFGLFAQLRSFGDNTGIPHHFAYVVSAETGVFGPSVSLAAAAPLQPESRKPARSVLRPRLLQLLRCAARCRSGGLALA